MNFYKTFLLLILLCILNSCKKTEIYELKTFQRGTISGIAYLYGTQNKEGISIELIGPDHDSTKTDAKGKFIFSNIKTGNYRIRYYYPGYSVTFSETPFFHMGGGKDTTLIDPVGINFRSTANVLSVKFDTINNFHLNFTTDPPNSYVIVFYSYSADVSDENYLATEEARLFSINKFEKGKTIYAFAVCNNLGRHYWDPDRNIEVYPFINKKGLRFSFINK